MEISTMIVAIVAISVIGKAISDIIKVKRGSKSSENELRERIEVLEDRIKVLEQIATDKRYRLKDEIDSL